MNKLAMITGATAGIGRATALLLAQNGFDLVITGRRRERLIDLEEEIKKETGSDIFSLHFDVRSRKEVNTALSELTGKWRKIDVLVNNAGLASGLNRFNDADIDDWETMIDTNIKGLLYVSKEISKLMVERKSGHIINLSSIAGKEVYPDGNVYCATKHAVDALSKAMRADLLEFNIKVTNIAPGMVDTEFSTVRFKGDKKKADKVYEGLTPLYASDIAECILFAVNRPQHVCINDLIVMPTAQASATQVKRVIED